MLKTVKFYGVLAKKFGKQFKVEAATTREAMRLIAVQVAGFEQFMLNAHHHGLRFAVFLDKHNIGDNEVDMHSNCSVIKVVPKVQGAGGNGGIFQLILGVVLIVVGVVTGNPALIGAGIGIAVGGVAQMLMPKVESQDQNQDGNRANFGFGGAVTTIGQGNPVPILYGEREIGGFVISGAQYPEDQL